MESVMEIVNNYVLPQWPFFAAMLVFMIIGEVMTRNVFTRTAHHHHKPVWFWWWGRKTLALHPIITGMLLGCFWRNPVDGVDTLVEACAYFAMAGALSVWAYETIKGIAKNQGVELDLPGVEETIPPSPPQQ
jgi:hypothetical protein